MKNYTIKTKHVLTVLAVVFTCMFSLSSCFTLLTLIAESKKPDAEKTYEKYRYHFMAKAPSGQMLCFTYLDSLNVMCTTPEFCWDSATKTSTKYELTGDVVIPKTVSNSGKTYNVSSLFISPSISEGITNLVLPPSIKEHRLSVYNNFGNLKNIICYGSEIVGRYIKSLSNAETRIHVPREIDYGEDDQVVKIVNGYDIYEKGHSLGEYLGMAQREIPQVTMMKKFYNGYDCVCSRAVYQSVALDPNFAVVDSTETAIMYFRFMDKEKKEVHFCGAVGSSGRSSDYEGGGYWRYLTVPSRVTYQGETYTVTSAYANSRIVALPETCKRFFTLDRSVQGNKELICYSSDIDIIDGYSVDILHVPYGCVEKYKGNAREACLEIVNSYSIYENGHSIKEYWNMSRAAVEKIKTAKEKAEEDARLERQKKKEAEQKALIAELNKKYGKKYVDAFLRGELAVGMPEELFVVGINADIFNRITGATLDHESAGSKCYKLYGYDSYETSTKISLSSSAFIGWVWVKNGRISSIKWL